MQINSLATINYTWKIQYSQRIFSDKMLDLLNFYIYIKCEGFFFDLLVNIHYKKRVN